MGTRLPSSWKGCSTQEGTGEREQVTLREGTVLFREGKGGLIGEQQNKNRLGQSETEDLTWGYRTPQGRLYTKIRKVDERGSIIRWHQETV